MKKVNISWREKYLLSLSEYMSVKDIMSLFEVGYSSASKIKEKAIDYCLINDIDIWGRLTPTEAILKVVDKDIEYFYNKMLLESKAV